MERHPGTLTGKPQREAHAETHTHPGIHTDTHTLADASVQTTRRSEVQISAGEGSYLRARGGHWDPRSGIFPDPARSAEG